MYGGLKLCCAALEGRGDALGTPPGEAAPGIAFAEFVHPCSLPVICDQALSIVVTSRPFCCSVVSHHWSERYGLHTVTVYVIPFAHTYGELRIGGAGL